MSDFFRSFRPSGNGTVSQVLSTVGTASSAFSKPGAGPTKLDSLVARVAQGAAIATAANSTYHTVRRWHANHFQWTLTIDEYDDLYRDVHAWLTDLIPGERQKTLKVWTGEPPKGRRSRPRRSLPSFDFEDEGFGPRPKPVVNVSFNDSRPRYINVEGYRIKVEVDTDEDIAASVGLAPTARHQKSITLTMGSSAAQDAVLNIMRKMQAEKTARKPALKIVNAWGDWSTRSDLPLRNLDSVILPSGQKEAIVEDLRKFIKDEQRYADLDLPYHRGYMLEGPAGTGKSSFVKAIANHFEMDLWYLPLADLKEESSLLDLLSSVSSRSIVLLEDIDTLQLTHDRDEGVPSPASDAPDAAGPPKSGQSSKLTLSGLLNVLDGVATPHGLITFMTTNHFDRLDSALTRAGRMDRVEHFGYPTADNVSELYRRFYPGHSIPGWMGGTDKVEVSMAVLTEALKRNMEDPVAGAAELLTHLESAVLRAND